MYPVHSRSRPPALEPRSKSYVVGLAIRFSGLTLFASAVPPHTLVYTSQLIPSLITVSLVDFTTHEPHHALPQTRQFACSRFSFLTCFLVFPLSMQAHSCDV